MQPLGSQDKLYKLENFGWWMSRPKRQGHAACALPKIIQKIKNTQKTQKNKERKKERPSRSFNPRDGSKNDSFPEGNVTRNRAALETTKSDFERKKLKINKIKKKKRKKKLDPKGHTPPFRRLTCTVDFLATITIGLYLLAGFCV